MKSRVQRFLQKLLGFNNYLFIFSIFKIASIRWDRGEKDFFHFLKLIEGDGILLDVGANIGIMSYHLAKSNQNRIVLSFEPLKENVRCLKRVKLLFSLGNLEIYPYAVGHEEGEMEMVMPEVDGVRKQGLSHALEIDPKVEGQKYSVKVKRIDDVVRGYDSHVVGVKLDVENYEYKALLGAERMMRRDKPIVYCELWDNDNRKDCFDFMLKMGYQVKILEGSKLVNFDRNHHKTQNFFFVNPVTFV